MRVKTLDRPGWPVEASHLLTRLPCIFKGPGKRCSALVSGESVQLRDWASYNIEACGPGMNVEEQSGGLFTH